jgi:hypothetical protein
MNLRACARRPAGRSDQCGRNGKRACHFVHIDPIASAARRTCAQIPLHEICVGLRRPAGARLPPPGGQEGGQVPGRWVYLRLHLSSIRVY